MDCTFMCTLMRPASPFQSFDFRESSIEAETCFVSAEATVTAAVDLRLREAKKPRKGTSDLVLLHNHVNKIDITWFGLR
jgi:hypothetical protein